MDILSFVVDACLCLAARLRFAIQVSVWTCNDDYDVDAEIPKNEKNCESEIRISE